MSASGASLLVLSEAEVQQLLDVDELIDALAGAFVELSAGRASVPARVATGTDRGLLMAMPGHVDGVLETKLVSLFSGNHSRGLPSHHAVIAVFDADTGVPVALVAATHITAIRTGAASALATRILAREDTSVLAVLGAGVQGRSHLQTVPRVRAFEEIRVANRDPGRAAALAADFGARAVDSFEEAVRGADVICACTNAPAPVLQREWLTPGAHVNSVGISPGGPELDDATVRAGVLAVESRVAFEPFPAGAHELAAAADLAGSAAELGELLAGARPGRTGDGQITVYKSVGHAVEDAVAARVALDRARRERAGTAVEL